jgi:hypothetical protein
MPGSSPSRRASLRTFIRGLAGAGLGGAALGAFGARGAARAATERAPIVGAWLLSEPGKPGLADDLVFFHDDGIIQYAGSPVRITHRPDDPEGAVEYQTLSGGQWVRTSFNEYAFTTVDIDYDASGNVIAIDTSRGTVTYDPLRDQWSGTFTTMETDPNGAPTGGARTATTIGRRIAVSP